MIDALAERSSQLRRHLLHDVQDVRDAIIGAVGADTEVYLLRRRIGLFTKPGISARELAGTAAEQDETGRTRNAVVMPRMGSAGAVSTCSKADILAGPDLPAASAGMT